jgi:hypothetical protein
MKGTISPRLRELLRSGITLAELLKLIKRR